MKNLVQTIELIEDSYLEMLRNVERFLKINLEMLKNGKYDPALSGEATMLEAKINELDLEVRENSIIALARFQPAATDLRKLVMMTDSARLLERMGDLLKANIYLIKEITENCSCYNFILADQSYPIVNKMKDLMEYYIKSFIEREEKPLYAIISLDEDIDSLVNQNYEKNLQFMVNEPEHIKCTTKIMFMDKKFERVSDHIVHLAKDLIYILNGSNMRKLELYLKNENEKNQKA